MALSGSAALVRALAYEGKEFGQTRCLNWVYRVFGSPSTKSPGGRYGNAVAAYNETIKALGRRLDADAAKAPIGAVHFWGPKYAGDPGHISLSLGSGMTMTTNVHQAVSRRNVLDDDGERRNMAIVGRTTVANASKGRGPYLGWALWAFDDTIAPAPAPAGGGASPINPTTPQAAQKDDDMPRMIAPVIGEIAGNPIVMTDGVSEWHVTGESKEVYALGRAFCGFPPSDSSDGGVRATIKSLGGELSGWEYNRAQQRVADRQAWEEQQRKSAANDAAKTIKIPSEINATIDTAAVAKSVADAVAKIVPTTKSVVDGVTAAVKSIFAKAGS